MTKNCFNCKFGDVALRNEPCRTCFNATDPPTHWQAAPDCLACAALRAENERLAEELQNQAIVATRDGVAAITWYGKYKVLHAENERLRGALEGYAKEDNWLNFEGHDVWQRDEPGSELATKALKGGGDA